MRWLLRWQPPLSKGLPANQHASQREKRLMDVGPFVVPDAQATKLIQPCKRALDNPSPASQAAAMCRAAHRDQWPNGAMSQPLSDRPRIVAAIRNNAIWPLSWSSTFTLQWRNRIDERQCFL